MIKNTFEKSPLEFFFWNRIRAKNLSKPRFFLLREMPDC